MQIKKFKKLKISKVKKKKLKKRKFQENKSNPERQLQLRIAESQGNKDGGKFRKKQTDRNTRWKNKKSIRIKMNISVVSMGRHTGRERRALRTCWQRKISKNRGSLIMI